MAYNTSKGDRELGDIKNENDPDTQIDFENDQISLKTGGANRLTATNTHVSCSVNLSASAFYGDGSTLSNLPGGGISWDGSTANGVATYKDADEATVESNLTFDGTDLGVSDKIVHIGDTDTFINFTDDDINFQAGGVNFMDLTEDTQNEVTFNEGGVDVDFRVETADESHMLFIEGSSNRMSIGDNTGSPGATLEVKNHASAGATGVPLLQLNNNDTDQQCVDINAGNIDANVVNITANDVTTARVLAIGADGLTTGNALYVDDNSPNTGTRNTALIIQNHTGAINAQALAVQSDGGKTGVKIDKNYSDLTEASIVGLDIDWDKTGASTSDNTMYGIQLDMDNTTATNGINYMYGLHVTPTLTHAANAGSTFVYGALINAQGGTNGSSLVQGARIEAGGGDINYGLQLDVEDGGVDLRIESSADSGDYFQIQTTTHGATTITTVDDNATAANLTFTVDGDITLDPAGGNVVVDGNLSASLNISASAFYGSGVNLTNVAAGGSIGNVQYNGGGPLGGSNNLSWDNPNNQLIVNGNVSGSYLSASAGVVAAIGVFGDNKTTVDATHISSSVNISGSKVYAANGVIIPHDSTKLEIGIGGDFYISHNTNTVMAASNGHLTLDVESSSKNLRFEMGDDAGATSVQFRNNSSNTVASTDSLGIMVGSSYGLLGVASGSVSVNDVIVAVGYNSNFVKFSKASPNTLIHGRGPFYVAAEGASDGGALRALKSKLVTGLNTSTATNVGDAVYLSAATSGSYVYTVPNPTADAAHFSLLVRVGRVLNIHASTGAIMLDPPDGSEPLVGQVIAGGGTSTHVDGFGAAFSGSSGSCAVLATANTDPAPGDDDQIKSARILSDGRLEITLDDSSGTPLLTYTIFA
tara:strand:- start:11349 stop:13970 length:2622 start_codon:yes stop_codon:yes gene_type:complete